MRERIRKRKIWIGQRIRKRKLWLGHSNLPTLQIELDDLVGKRDKIRDTHTRPVDEEVFRAIQEEEEEKVGLMNRNFVITEKALAAGVRARDRTLLLEKLKVFDMSEDEYKNLAKKKLNI
mmetsp:Transcript_9941/g.11332  ORF Transcript_9941/g.11332 Transcript_9941/m.11332 type:complete len:120 (+) Transcript_9941:259-618(+)